MSPPARIAPIAHSSYRELLLQYDALLRSFDVLAGQRKAASGIANAEKASKKQTRRAIVAAHGRHLGWGTGRVKAESIIADIRMIMGRSRSTIRADLLSMLGSNDPIIASNPNGSDTD